MTWSDKEIDDSARCNIHRKYYRIVQHCMRWRRRDKEKGKGDFIMNHPEKIMYSTLNNNIINECKFIHNEFLCLMYDLMNTNIANPPTIPRSCHKWRTYFMPSRFRSNLDFDTRSCNCHSRRRIWLQVDKRNNPIWRQLPLPLAKVLRWKETHKISWLICCLGIYSSLWAITGSDSERIPEKQSFFKVRCCNLAHTNNKVYWYQGSK